MATVEPTNRSNDKKQKALNTALSQIERAYGKGSIMRMGADGFNSEIEVIPTGAINLDAAIGIGGIPRGRISEIYGPESSGKTTLCLHIIANAQRQGGIAAFIDAEHALDVPRGIGNETKRREKGFRDVTARARRYPGPLRQSVVHNSPFLLLYDPGEGLELRN